MPAPYADSEVFAAMPWWVWAALGLVWLVGSIVVYRWLQRRSRRRRP